MAERFRSSREQAFRKNIFWGEGQSPLLVAGEHNVRHLLPSAPEEDRHLVRVAYAQRGLAMPVPTESGRRMGLLVDIPNDPTVDVAGDIRAQIGYLNGMIPGRLPHVEVFHKEDLLNARGTLVVPYLNPPDEEASLQRLGAEIYGPPAQLFEEVNDKARFHDWAAQYADEVDPQFRVAKHKNVLTEDIAAAGPDFLKEIVQTYEDTGLLGEYEAKGAVGIVLRGSDSDGGFGITKVRFRKDVDGDYWTVETSPGEKFSNQNDAFKAAQGYFETMNRQVNDTIVMTRFMDVEESPGESILFSEGHVFSLGWNGQMQDGEDTACIGTNVYTPVSEQSRKVYEEQKDQTANQYAGFIRYVADKIGIDFEGLNMVVNQDMMTPTELEARYQRALGQPVHMVRPELNFRLSERTDAVVGAAVLGGTTQTPEGLIEASNKLTTYLKYPMPKGLDPRIVREALGEEYQGKTVGDEGTIFVRVASTPQPDDPTDSPRLGLAIYGDHDVHVAKLNGIISSLASKR